MVTRYRIKLSVFESLARKHHVGHQFRSFVVKMNLFERRDLENLLKPQRTEASSQLALLYELWGGNFRCVLPHEKCVIFVKLILRKFTLKMLQRKFLHFLVSGWSRGLVAGGCLLTCYCFDSKRMED